MIFSPLLSLLTFKRKEEERKKERKKKERKKTLKTHNLQIILL
jgi:hypothetical protein